jgi:hypothetical protein
MSTQQTQISRSNSSSQRQRPLFQAAGVVFHSSPTDRLIGDFRRARDAVAGWKRMDAAARAKLGQVNSHDRQWRRASQADAMCALNKVRAGMRANYQALDAAKAALLALGVRWEAV